VPAKNKKLLIIDDDQLLADAVSRQFSRDGVDVVTAFSCADGLMKCAKDKMDVVLLDQQLPDGLGVDICSEILSYNDRSKIIFITAYPSFDHAVDAIKVGAYDYISKPFEMEELALSVTHAIRTIDLEQIEQVHRYKSQKESDGAVLIGADNGLVEINRLVALAASNNAPALITGKTGTGKSIVAKSIHYQSGGKSAAFIHLNCAALPENLIESELFGHEKGAFTGAVASKKGAFEMAEGGTLFLDEIGEMPYHLQSKLLGVLDEYKVKRLGGGIERPVNVRVIAATNTDVEKAVKEKQFREDLYYRLGVILIHLPTLKEREQDIPALCNYFIRETSQDPALVLPQDEIQRLQAYNWPGNVRELKNIIERSIILQQGKHLQPSKLLGQKAPRMENTESSADSSSAWQTLEQIEKSHIEKTLERFSKNQSQAAKALGISRSTLKRKIQLYSI